jgi:hypothetical protein
MMVVESSSPSKTQSSGFGKGLKEVAVVYTGERQPVKRIAITIPMTKRGRAMVFLI